MRLRRAISFAQLLCLGYAYGQSCASSNNLTCEPTPPSPMPPRPPTLPPPDVPHWVTTTLTLGTNTSAHDADISDNVLRARLAAACAVDADVVSLARHHHHHGDDTDTETMLTTVHVVVSVPSAAAAFLVLFRLRPLVSDGMASLGPYPGAPCCSEGGTLMVHSLATAVHIEGVVTGVSSSGGWHVHTGSSCASAAEVGGHLLTATGDDPWVNLTYNLPSGGTVARVDATVGGFTLSGGTGVSSIQGRVIVLHNRAGGRIGCGVISTARAVHLGTEVEAVSEPAVQLVPAPPAQPPEASGERGDAARLQLTLIAVMLIAVCGCCGLVAYCLRRRRQRPRAGRADKQPMNAFASRGPKTGNPKKDKLGAGKLGAGIQMLKLERSKTLSAKWAASKYGKFEDEETDESPALSGALSGDGADDGASADECVSPNLSTSASASASAGARGSAGAGARGSASLGVDPSTGWKQMVDDQSGYPYWYNTVTGESTWDKPPGFTKEMDAAPTPPDLPLSTLPAQPGNWGAEIDTAFAIEEPPPKARLPPGWEAHEDEDTGEVYFFHTMTGETSWEMPRY